MIEDQDKSFDDLADDNGRLSLIGQTISHEQQSLLTERLITIAGEQKSWLTQRAIDYAKQTGYARYTTTIWAAWEVAINALNGGLVRFLTERSDTWHLNADIDYRRVESLEDLIRVGQVHRAMGISFQHFMGLMKYFRLTYLDLVDAHTQEGVDRAAMRAFLHSYFDKSELAICTDWAETSDDRRLQVLSDRLQSLILEKDKYLTIFESLKDPAFVLDQHNKVINANHAANQVFGPGGEPGGIYYAEYRRSACKQFDQLISQILLQKSPAQWLQTRTEERCFDIRKTPVHDTCSNTQLGSVLILHDVTDHQHAIEQSRKASRSKSAFLATVSHEIRTPLNSILGAMELIGNSPPNRKDVYLGAIEIAAKRLFSMLGQVLDYSKLEAGVFVARIEDVAVREYFGEFEQFSSAWAESQGIDLALHIDRNVPTRLAFDRQRVHQLLTNLVSNAIKHDRSGCVDVTVAYERQESDEGQLCFMVDDGGDGVPPEIAERLFHPYVQGGVNDENGTGLGLAICSEIVKGLDGDIGFCNRPTGGTRFWFHLPASPRDAVTAQKLEELDDLSGRVQGAPEGAILANRPSMLLLVDDDSISSMIATDILTNAGHTVHCATTGKEAIDMAHRQAFDLALVDYRLPDMTGDEVVLAFKSDDRLHSPLIVAFTANPELIAQHDTADLFFATLSKPISANALIKSVDYCLEADPNGALPESIYNDHKAPAPNAKEAISAKHATLFLDTYRADIPPFLSKLAHGSETEVVETAHRMASAALTLGLNDLGESLIELEREIRDTNRVHSGASWADHLGPLFEQAIAQLGDANTQTRSNGGAS